MGGRRQEAKFNFKTFNAPLSWMQTQFHTEKIFLDRGIFFKAIYTTSTLNTKANVLAHNIAVKSGMNSLKRVIFSDKKFWGENAF